ncbi:hypothetical protein PHYSODRAFT_488407 [Phytophthora sojae]|uniref:Helicase-associated domain-containing protein n=1 Tax=Phytophthora sojae (strain P6497) TaxID=1094619 RepID=G4Z7Z5_PHYSP|nr:hypothetical protein PHYSODRAFT_488407 [Phytophthora sojae]EGZ22530.1 hypothetical protein PHYSODRAFT_488407 [Phytophthora sojae]|eukprot:XP_009525247.1 hypothetical protein PHYSODRAFT_488407 [Phytophthora sojae]
MTLIDRDWEEKILPSIRVYRQEPGNCIMPQAFVVPSSAPWPEKAWGKPLGIVVSEMRFRKAYAEQAARDKDVLDALGFAWDRSDAVWNEIVIPALEVYVDTCRNGKVPFQFVVPSEDPWPRGSAWDGYS